MAQELKAYNVICTDDISEDYDVDALGAVDFEAYNCDDVDEHIRKMEAEKDAEIRRLNRKYWNDKADEAAKMKRLIYDGRIIYLDEYCNEQDWRIMHKVWEDEETKCRATAEEYK